MIKRNTTYVIDINTVVLIFCLDDLIFMMLTFHLPDSG